MALAAFTGMRRGELLGLRWMDVDLAGRRVYLRETKNGSLRVVPLNELAFMVLASLPQARRKTLCYREWTRRSSASIREGSLKAWESPMLRSIRSGTPPQAGL
jgi:integrase